MNDSGACVNPEVCHLQIKALQDQGAEILAKLTELQIAVASGNVAAMNASTMAKEAKHALFGEDLKSGIIRDLILLEQRVIATENTGSETKQAVAEQKKWLVGIICSIAATAILLLVNMYTERQSKIEQRQYDAQTSRMDRIQAAQENNP